MKRGVKVFIETGMMPSVGSIRVSLSRIRLSPLHNAHGFFLSKSLTYKYYNTKMS